MTMLSDLSRDLVGEILSRVPITSLREVRSTCKRWNGLSKHQILGRATEAPKQFLGFMIMDYKICSVRFDLNGIHKEEDDHGDQSIKHIGKFNQIEISKVFHYYGLLLCATKDNKKLVVWNPYLDQTKWIEPKDTFHRFDRYALGYDKNKKSYKILRFADDNMRGIIVFAFEIYDLNSNTWRVLDVNPDWVIEFFRHGVSLKGNAYFFAKEKLEENELEVDDAVDADVDDFLLSFDFTKERFGPRLDVPFHSHFSEDIVTLSCVGEEKLAVLFQSMGTYMLEIWVTTKIEPRLEIWVTTKIEPEAVSWSKLFLSIDMSPHTGLRFQVEPGCFFIDEEKKLAVVFDLDQVERYKSAYIIGEKDYFDEVALGENVNLEGSFNRCSIVCSYLPTLVQINQGLVLSGKRKER